ncbi:MAG: multiubiquitin domain-containing protein [Streptosporangiaceae bacterium]|nr:multiubiquitin domain-containing protein [Streptosporangiaceae bacterium]
MTEPVTTPIGAAADHKPLVQVLVNGQKVVLHQSEATGEQIKAAAIAAGVPIQPDFVLSEVLPSGKQKMVPDDRKIHLKDGDEFWAIPGDDNS